MIASRAAQDIRAHDVVTITVGPITHVGPVVNVHEADDAPIRTVIVLDCRVCGHCDAVHFAPSALVTVERAA